MKILAERRNTFSFLIISVILTLTLISLTGCYKKKKINTDPYINRVSDDVLYQPTDDQAGKDEKRPGMGENEFSTEEITEESETLASNMAAAGGQPHGEGALTPEMQAIVNEDIHFEYDSSRLTPAAIEILKQKAERLRNSPNISVVLEGYTDSRGTTEYNLALGERRAESAKAFLVDAGVPAIRMMVISYGEENPVDPTENEAAWAKNRRVHFVIKK